MIITNDLFEIEDQIEKLVTAILASNSTKSYQEAKKKLDNSVSVQEKKQSFIRAKEAFEQMEQYGSFAPDFKEKQRTVRKAKRVLDLTEEVAEFRMAEMTIQTILDTISLAIARTVSEEVKVATGNPFFEKVQKAGCGGSCHAS